MKKDEVQIGQVYQVKVSGKFCRCQIINASSFGGWNASNLDTGRTIRIKTAARLQKVVLPDLKHKETVRQNLNQANENQRKTSQTAPHLVVEARAGTGKTFTLIEGLKRIKGQPTPGVQGSPQQEAVWEEMVQGQKPQSITFCAFNKSIATELQTKVPQGRQAMTLHSLGNSACRRAFGKFEVNSWKVQNILEELLGKDIWEVRRQKPNLVKATEDLVGLCKQNLTFHNRLDLLPEEWSEALTELVNHYGIELNGDRKEVFRLVPQVLEACKTRTHEIDFNDMIWLPVVLGLPVFQNDLLLVDEAQDLNRCQQALAMKAGKRLILCGDPRQAIHGFAGADTDSIPRMVQTLSETSRGCKVLPLTVTRRCGKAIVELAKTIVPDFEAFEMNPEGIIERAKMSGVQKTEGTEDQQQPAEEGYGKAVGAEDMILCRVNAPLVSEVFRFLREGGKANIQGRGIGQGLLRLIDKMDALDVPELTMKITDWSHQETEKEARKRNPSEARLIGIQDKRDCLLAFCENVQSVAEIRSKIEQIFSDTNGGGIRLSSIHRAKGLESNNVFILIPKGASMPHPMAKSDWQRQQEENLRYVAITRAIHRLTWVTD